MGVFLASIFVVALGWLPGTATLVAGGGWSVASQFVLPVAVIVLYDAGYVVSMIRASMVEVMQRPYIRTAVLKGMAFRWVVLRHALRNAMINPVTVICLQLSYLVSGVVVVETVFAYPGFGRMMLEAALFKDIALIEAGALVAVGVAILHAGPGRPRLHAPRPEDPRVTPPGVDSAAVQPVALPRAPSALAGLRTLGRGTPAGHRVSRGDRRPRDRPPLGGWPRSWRRCSRPTRPTRPTSRRSRAPPPRARTGSAPTTSAGTSSRGSCGALARCFAVAPLAVLGATLLGALLGLSAGYYRGWVDLLISRAGDIILTFPVIILYMIVLAAFGSSAGNIVAVLTLTKAPIIARIVRGLTLELREREYVAAAKMRGESALYIMVVEILPNARGPLLVDMCLRMGYTIVLIGVLGFLGIGLPPPDPDWGGMVKDTYGMMSVWPHMSLYPCAAISSLVIGFNLLAVGLREIALRD